MRKNSRNRLSSNSKNVLPPQPNHYYNNQQNDIQHVGLNGLKKQRNTNSISNINPEQYTSGPGYFQQQYPEKLPEYQDYNNTTKPSKMFDNQYANNMNDLNALELEFSSTFEKMEKLIMMQANNSKPMNHNYRPEVTKKKETKEDYNDLLKDVLDSCDLRGSEENPLHDKFSSYKTSDRRNSLNGREKYDSEYKQDMDEVFGNNESSKYGDKFREEEELAKKKAEEKRLMKEKKKMFAARNDDNYETQGSGTFHNKIEEKEEHDESSKKDEEMQDFEA